MALATPRIDTLRAGHDTGHYTLPAALLAAYDARDRIGEALNTYPPAPEPLDVHDDLVAATVKAAAAGKAFPKVTPLVNAHAAVAAHGYELAILRAAFEHANDRVISTATAPIVFAESLQPALAETLEHIRTDVIPNLPDEAASDSAMIYAAPEVIAAWRRMTELTTRYSVIRNAQRAYGAPTYDRDEYAEMRNLEALWPRTQRPSALGAVETPWPNESRARLLWLIKHGADLAVLTPEERDGLAQADFDKGVEERLNRNNRPLSAA